MKKRVEFHQANIQIAFKIVDDEKSYGLKTAEFSLLMDTPEEWATAQEAIRKARERLEEGIDHGDSA